MTGEWFSYFKEYRQVAAQKAREGFPLLLSFLHTKGSGLQSFIDEVKWAFLRSEKRFS